MLALFELPQGYALFRVGTGDALQLCALKQFKDSAEAVEATNALMDSQVHKSLKKFLKKELTDRGLQDELAVLDIKLGGAIQTSLGIKCKSGEAIDKIFRTIREKIVELLSDMNDDVMHQMRVGLAHTLNRHILKFSADKIDVMVIQAVGLLEDLDKELNTYSMRVKEWYGWHFPEMTKVVGDNNTYAKVVLKMGVRQNAAATDFGDVITEDIVKDLREAAIHSMGIALTEEDIEHIKQLAHECVLTAEYRQQMADYLKNRMIGIAPNLTAMVGEMVGAKLLAHAGSLLKLAKSPASTIQILGAEKALFRALKKKHETPKYGLMYHASLVGQAPAKHKGTIARVLGTKTALAARVDAFTEEEHPTATIGVEGRVYVERRLRQLESGTTYAMGTKAPATASSANDTIREFKALKAKKKAGDLTPEEKARFKKLKAEREAIKGEDDGEPPAKKAKA